jgi:hypothetical protein
MFTIDLRASDIFIRKYQMKVPLILLVLFGIFLALPATFRATRDLLGPWVADAGGDPTGLGFFFHALVLTILVLGFSKTISTFKGGDGKAHRDGKSRFSFKDYEDGLSCQTPSDSAAPATAEGQRFTGRIKPDLKTCAPAPSPV